MSLAGWAQTGLLFLVVLALIKPLGLYMARVFSGERTLLSVVHGPVERASHAAGGIKADSRQVSGGNQTEGEPATPDPSLSQDP